MGEGLGAGGHSTRRCQYNARVSAGVSSGQNYFRALARRAAWRRRVRARRAGSTGNSICLPSGKLEISQMDAKRSPASAAALDDVARADREPAGEITWEQGHDNPPRNFLELAGTNGRRARQFRDRKAPAPDFCESLWTKCSRAARDTFAGRKFPDAVGFFATPCQARAASRATTLLRVKDRNRSPAPMP